MEQKKTEETEIERLDSYLSASLAQGNNMVHAPTITRVALLIVFAALAPQIGCGRTVPKPKNDNRVESTERPQLPPVSTTQSLESTREKRTAMGWVEQWGGLVRRFDGSAEGPISTLLLNSSSIVSVESVHLKLFPDLVVLDLASTAIDDEALRNISQLGKLETLNLAETEVTDSGLVHLRGLAKLQGLSLKGTPVTSACVAHLKELRNLKALNLGGTTVNDEAVPILVQMTGLNQLGLVGTQISTQGLKRIRDSLPSTTVE